MRRIHPHVLIAVALLSFACHEPPRSLILEGTVVTPNVVLNPGWIVVEGSRIRSVSGSRPDVPRATSLKTDALIFPGLIDLHNHVSWNVFPRWTPGERYANRHEWRELPTYRALMAVPGRRLLTRHSCDMNRYGEIRALIGGATSIQGGPRRLCVNGLARNLDFHSEFDPALGPKRDAVQTIADITLLADARRRRIAQWAREEAVHRVFVHVAEGRRGDPKARAEFATLQRHRLLGPKTVIVHGSALTGEELRAVREAGASLVWSPRSNMTLYGETTDIPAVLNLGIPVALAPDWAVTGSSNLLDELRYAARFNDVELGGRLTEKQLVAMVTETAAQIAAIDDKVGTIREGLFADLLVIKGDNTRPHQSLVSARPRDVRLVVVGGRPVYGARDLVDQLRAGSWEHLNVCGTAMAVDLTAGPVPALRRAGRFAALEARLRKAMEAVRGDAALSPLAECEAAALRTPAVAGQTGR